MGGTKCLRLGTCELECMGGVLQNDSSISKGRLNTPEGASAREPHGKRTRRRRETRGAAALFRPPDKRRRRESYRSIPVGDFHAERKTG